MLLGGMHVSNIAQPGHRKDDMIDEIKILRGVPRFRPGTLPLRRKRDN